MTRPKTTKGLESKITRIRSQQKRESMVPWKIVE
jgi:hypothetical protein